MPRVGAAAQEEEFDNRVMGTKLHNPDFVALAKSFGVRGVLAEDAAALELAVREAVEEGERGNPTLIPDSLLLTLAEAGVGMADGALEEARLLPARCYLSGRFGLRDR